jgi:hypothetical protein
VPGARVFDADEHPASESRIAIDVQAPRLIR